MKITALKLKHLFPSPTNPRKHFDPQELKDLASSIKEKGILEPILVREDKKVMGRYEIVAGERRYRASKLAELDEAPCIIRELTDQQTVEIQVVENMQRQDLTPLEEATGYKALIDDFKYTMDDLAHKIGKSKSYINSRFRLLTLSTKARKLMADGTLPLAMAMELIRVPDHGQQDKILDESVEDDYGDIKTAAELRQYIEREYLLELKRAPFNTNDAKLCPAAGACSACPKRTGAQAGLFGDMGKADVCLDAKCWNLKVSTQGKNLIKKYEAEGKTVLGGTAAEKFLERPHDKGFVELDEKVTDLRGATTTRAALRKNGIEGDVAVTAVIDDEGQVHQYVKVQDVKAALPKKAFKTESEKDWHDDGESISGSSSRSSSAPKVSKAARRKRLLDLKASRMAWKAAWMSVIENLQVRELKGEVLKTFANILVTYITPNDYETRKRAGAETKTMLARSTNDKQLRNTMWQVALGGGLSYDDTSLTDQAKKIFALAGVDWTKLKNKAAVEITKAKAAKDKAKKK